VDLVLAFFPGILPESEMELFGFEQQSPFGLFSASRYRAHPLIALSPRSDKAARKGRPGQDDREIRY